MKESIENGGHLCNKLQVVIIIISKMIINDYYQKKKTREGFL